ncbi:hypothetical protein NQ315_016212 [Exocentrus adspersus]|uniref:Uncharacterized protein n=1 Tax=Exocentrus adspersus TaxID=1586481 RepID=A0AAV8VJ13_9CUCU|nr:hypothetical protein NQ315_016212 [Exocentrus adspersus]
MLPKWCSNYDELLDEQGMHELPAYYIAKNEQIKTLGLGWNQTEDIFMYSVNLGPACETVTKRSILAVIAKIFDPLGLIGPVTVQAKLLIQTLWQAQIYWDEAIPEEIYRTWKTFHDSLSYINYIKIPRQVTIPNPTQIQMHGFSDASELSFGACIYIRTRDANRKLNGALLLARLASKIETALDTPIPEKYLWCDSTIVLNWLSAEPSNWNTYVANRVTEIQELNLNPADIISRGSSPNNLKANPLWWSGPDFFLA